MLRPLPTTTWLLTSALVAGIGAFGGAALASTPLVLPKKEPKDLAGLREQISTVQAATAIPACGGVLADESVGEELGDGVSQVSGLPGRSGKPLAALRSGLGVKESAGGQFDDGFMFPDTTTGFSTRCPLGVTALRKYQFDNIYLTKVRFPDIAAPQFGDPPCLKTPGACADFCRELNTYTYPDCAVVKGDLDRGIGCALWCEKETCTDAWVGGSESCNESLSALTNGEMKDSPEVPALRSYNGRLLFLNQDGRFVWYQSGKQTALDEDGNPLSYGNTEEVPDNTVANPPSPSQYNNCVPCTGEECRCSLQPVTGVEKNPVCLLQLADFDVGAPDMSNLSPDDARLIEGCRVANTKVIREDSRSFDNDNITNIQDCQNELGKDGITLEPGVYASFFRQYQATIARRAFTEVAPNDQNQADAQVACYGFYDEFDPLDRQTKMIPGNEPDSAKDARCVINLDTTQFPSTQVGRGDDPISSEAADFTVSARDPLIDPWYQKLAGAFSLLHSAKYTLTTAILGLKEKDPVALNALPREHKATIPDFDETASQRIITTWWAELSSVFSEALSPPTLTLLLPKLPDDLTADDPLFASAITVHKPTTDPTAPLEVQLGVGEDLVGQVADFLARDTVFNISEEPMPVLLPAGSPDDWRALAQGWCTAITKTGVEGCDMDTLQSQAPKVADFVKRLEEYAAGIDEVNSLKAELTKTLTDLLKSRQDSLKTISDWRDDAEAVMKKPVEEAARLKALQSRWKDISLAYAAVGALTNMPWCMNQRFTLPIYWLLDPWLPSREEDGLISTEGLPLPKFLPRPPDLELDLSLLQIQKGTIKVAVLVPTQDRLDLVRLAPPVSKEQMDPVTLPPFPDLQPIRDALASARLSLGETQVISKPPLPETPEILSPERETELTTALDQAEKFVGEMDDAYRRFWEPLEPQFTADREALSCDFWGEGICHYSEMELIETLMRMMSRVGVFLKEDLTNLSPLGRATSTTCTLNDGGCLPMAPVDKPTPEGWQIMAPDTSPETLDAARKKIRDAMLPTTIDSESSSSLKAIPWSYEGPDLLPGLAMPPAIELIPVPPTKQ